MKQQNYYQLLGVAHHANTDDIKRAYRALIKKHHPDKTPNSQHVADINQAYETLKDPKKRANYDQQLWQEKLSQSRFFKTLDNVATQMTQNWQHTQRKFKENFGDNVAFIKENWQKFDHNKKRKQGDVLMELAIFPWQVALGETVLIKTARQTLRLTLPSHANHGTCLKIAGAGDVINQKTGDLYITLIIKNPDTHQLSDEQRQAFLRLKEVFR